MRRTAGFSLVELTAAIAIAGVLVGAAVPGFRGFVLDSQRAAVANDLLGTMQLARSEALKRGQDVIVCASSDGRSCGSDWRRGWVIFVNRTGSISPCVIETGGNPADFILKYSVNGYAEIGIQSNRDCYAFRPFNVHLAGGTITVCDPRALADSSQARAIIVSSVGRSRISAKNSNNEPLSCS